MSRVRSLPVRPRQLVVALLVLGMAGLLAIAMLADPRRESSGPSGQSAGSESSAPRELAAAEAPGVGATTTDVAADSTLSIPSIEPRIVRTGVMELRVRRGRFEDAWRDASVVAGAFGGSIASASRSGAGDGPRVGTITLRVPSARFDAAVDRLRETPRTAVRRLDIASKDVTQEFVDVKSRLRHDRAVEGRLLGLLAQTRGVGEVLAVQARLDQVQEQIEVQTGRLGYLATMTSTSSIAITLRDPGAMSAPRRDAEDEPSKIGSAFVEARERATNHIAAAIVWLGGAVPALVVLLVVGIVVRVAWRRRSTP